MICTVCIFIFLFIWYENTIDDNDIPTFNEYIKNVFELDIWN